MKPILTYSGDEPYKLPVIDPDFCTVIDDNLRYVILSTIDTIERLREIDHSFSLVLEKHNRAILDKIEEDKNIGRLNAAFYGAIIAHAVLEEQASELESELTANYLPKVSDSTLKHVIDSSEIVEMAVKAQIRIPRYNPLLERLLQDFMPIILDPDYLRTNSQADLPLYFGGCLLYSLLGNQATFDVTTTRNHDIIN